jgi:pyruvate dehydrogenase E2 component (dihydrolipoamide acetyltransferase)
VQAAAASGRATSGAVAATPATPPPSASATAWSAKVVDRASRARRATAELTAASWRTIPHFYLELEAELEAGLALARPTPLVCAAAARALLRHPECNLEWSGDRLVPRQRVDLGLLVDTPDGLLISVVRDAADLDLAAMAEAVTAASDRARAGILGPADLGTRSLTVSNLGMHPVDRFSAVIPAPDILALAVGRVRTVARWQGSSFEPRRVVSLTLSVDHRALDGSAAARLLADLEALLRDPASEGLA